MLNPFATDFKPFTPEQKVSTQIPNKSEDQTKKKPDAKKKQSTKPKKSNVKIESQSKAESSNSQKKKDTLNKKNPTRSRRKSSHQEVTTAPPITDQFSKETQFVAIEAAIDPIHRLDNHNLSINVNNSRRTSLAQESKFEHGYERYIDWIDRSLKLFDTVTVVGMDKAIVDVVSMVTILYDRRIGAHDDIETFSMNPGNGKMTSCIQVKLHPYL